MQLHWNPLDQPGWRFAQELQKLDCSESLFYMTDFKATSSTRLARARLGAFFPDTGTFSDDTRKAMITSPTQALQTPTSSSKQSRRHDYKPCPPPPPCPPHAPLYCTSRIHPKQCLLATQTSHRHMQGEVGLAGPARSRMNRLTFTDLPAAAAPDDRSSHA